MKDKQPIDLVVLWVDDSDPVWREKRAAALGKDEREGNTAVRYRDWGTLKYWFRGVEKFAPWVRNVYFVTDDQKPEWLNLDHPKLKWVKHTDFIPSEYLPTFSCQAIEWNLHKIKGLSEQFVYFNDDMFLIKKTSPKDFFVNGLPCDLPNIGVLYPETFFSYLLFNNISLLNRHFSLRESIKNHFFKWIRHQPIKGMVKLAIYGRKKLIPGSNNPHIQISYLKKTFETLWNKEREVIHATCQNKARTKNDITTWCVRDFQLFSGNFYPKKPIGKMFHTADLSHSNEPIEYLRRQKGKVICLNDTEDERDFEAHRAAILAAFEEILPGKSAFEK